MSEEERQQRNAEFLKDVVAVCDNHPSCGSQGNRSDNDVRLLVKHSLEPLKWLTRSYLELGMHSEEGVRAKEKLIAEGFVREHKMVRKGSGGQPTLLEVLPAGIAVVQRMGLSPVSPDGKGDFKHWAYAEGYVMSWAKKKGCRSWRERSLGGKQIDVVIEDEYKRLIACEICLSGSAVYNADAGVRCATIDGIFHVILACEDKKLMKRIKMELNSEMMNIQKKIEVMFLGEFWPGED